MHVIFMTILLSLVTSVAAAQTFTTIDAYCAAMSEASTPTLRTRAAGVSKQQAVDLMRGMMDPKSIKMVKELIEFAYSEPQGSTLDQMQARLKQLCVSRKIFAQ